ncbi:hypothetical protein ACOMHN_042496 [Nucella lapillus]
MELGILHNSPPSTKRGCRAGRLHRLWHGLPPAPWPCTRSQHHSVPSRNLHPLMVPPFLQPHPDLQSAVGNAPLSSKHPAQLPTTDCLLSIISPMGGQPSDAPALSPPSPLQQGGQSSNAPALSPPSPLPQGGQPIALALSPPSPPPQGGQPSDAPGLSPSSSTLLLCPSDSTLNICHLNSQSAVKTVDLGDYSVAKIISGIQYVQDTVACSKPYEWLMQGGAAILKVTRLGRCLVTLTSWGSEAVGKVLNGVRWTYAILGLSAVGREGQRRSLWEQGAQNTALCAVHSSLLYVRDDSLTHIRQARARRDAGTKPAPTNKERPLLWRGAIRLSKHRPSVALHPWGEDSGNGAGGGGRGGRGGGGGGGRRKGHGDGDTAAGGKRGMTRKHGGVGDGRDGGGCGGGSGYGGGDYGGNEERYCNTGQAKLNRGGEKEREQDRTDKDSHHPNNEPNERQNQDSSDNQRALNGREQHEKLRREGDTPKSRSGSEKDNGVEENHQHHHHDETTDVESFSSHEDFENRPGGTSESSECSYIVGGYQTPTLARSPFAERQVHVVKMPKHKPPSSSTRRETSKNTSSESSEVASQPEDIEESSDKATTRGEDSNRTPPSCKILKAAVTPCVWSPQEASSSTPHHPNASKPLPPCFGDSVISVLNGLSVCVRNEVREVKVKELRVNGEGVRVRVMPVGWSRCGSPRVRLSSLDRKGGVSARKVSDGGQLAARRKFPYLSDIIRDPRDPPAVSFLLDTPVLITNDKTRRLLDWTLASKSMSGCVKRTLDDLYSEDSYDSEQDPDYQPSESLNTTDPLEYSEQDAAEEEESSDKVFSFKPSRQKTTEVAAEIHRGEEHSIVLSPDHYDDTPTTTREPQSKRHVRKLGRLVLAPKRPELNPKLHDNKPSRVDTDAGPKKNHFVFSEGVGMTSKQQQDKGELGLTGHGLTPRRQGVMRKDESDGEKKSAEKVEGVCCSSENGGGDGEELKPEGSDSDKENSPSHWLGLDKNLGRKHVVNFHDYDRSDDYDSHSN